MTIDFEELGDIGKLMHEKYGVTGGETDMVPSRQAIHNLTPAADLQKQPSGRGPG